MIREAVRADIPHLVVMGLRFIRSTGYKGQLGEDPDALFDFMMRLIDADTAAILVTASDQSGPYGMIGVHIFQHPMSHEIFGNELFWWVEPGHRGDGLKLLHAGEDWMLSAGAHKIEATAPDDRTGKALERLGYKKFETHYLKVI